MFTNIGHKIKILAQILCWGGIIISVGIGISLFDVSELTGCIVLLAGPCISWPSSFFMYGFGQLVENSDIIADHLIAKKAKADAHKQA